MNLQWTPPAIRWFLAGVLLLFCVACGGGGSGGGDNGGADTSANLGTGVAVNIAGDTFSFQDNEGDLWTYRKRAAGRSAAAVPSDLVGSWEIIALEGAPSAVNATNSVWTFASDGTYSWFFFYPDYFDLSGTGRWTLVGSTLYVSGIVAQSILAGVQGPDSGCEVVVNPQGPAFLKIINALSSEVDVEFQTLPLTATMRPGACELYGLPAGAHGVDYVLLSTGAVYSRNHFLRAGETETFRVEAYLFP